MKAASMFSGIGGAELALPEANWLWCAEIEPFPSAVLAQRFGHPNLGNVLAPDFIDRALAFGRLDLLCGGPPCQAFSIAGNRLSMADPRGNLSLRFVQVAHAIRPRNLLVENVPGWLNTTDNAFGCFLGAIVGGDEPLRCPTDGSWPNAGMVAGPAGKVAWRVLDAQYAGLAQRRRRVFVVVDFGDGADPAAVLFERQGLLGNHPPRREKGEGVTGTLSARAQGGGGLGTDFEIDGGLATVCGDIAPTLSAAFGEKQGLEDQHINGGGGCSLPAVSMCLNAGAMGRIDAESETLIPVNRCDFDDAPVPFSIMPMNSGKDYKARETDVAQPIMAGGPVGGNQGGDYVCQSIAFPERLSATQHASAENISPSLGATNPMAIAFALRGRDEGAVPEVEGDGSRVGALRSASGGSSRDYIAFAQNQRDELRTMEVAGSLAADPGIKQQTYVATQWAVRRLTVTECERLQGYPDGWTLIDFGSRRTVEPDMAEYLRAKGVIVEADNRTGKLKTNAAADGPRYKSLGNAWAVACVRRIALKIYQRLVSGSIGP